MENNIIITKLVQVVAETLKEAGINGMPSGHLYAALNSKGLSLDAYNSLIGAFKSQGMIKESNYLLTWIA